jgi:very-short-patch-repair endonuclease
MSLPELLLWRELRCVPDVKFRRQHPIGPYILDFYCDQARLAVEVDGSSHAMGDRPARDERRDAWLARESVTVMRLPAVEVLKNLDAAVQAILAAARRA